MGLEGLSEKGARVSFSSNWDVPGRWRLIVDAPGRRLVSAPLETGQVLRRGESALDLEPSSEDRQFKPGLHGQAVAFLQVIRSGRSPLWPACTLEESVHSMALAERLTRACEGS